MRKQSILVPEPHLDETVYLVLNDFDRRGTAYVETDTAEADLETVTRNFLSGQYSRPVRVVAFNVCEQWSCDVSEDIAIEVGRRAAAAGDHLSEATTAFSIDTADLKRRRPPHR
jgi:hypothetical protein